MGKRKAKSPIAGRWSIDSMSMWDKEYIDKEVPGYFEFGPDDLGSFQFGYVEGDVDYRVTQPGDKPTIEFSFEGGDGADGTPCTGPYAFPFRSTDGNLDFVLVSVHLKPSTGPANRARRKHELGAVAAWIDAHDATEKDFIVLGDMNIGSETELASATPEGFLSLNDECRSTNTGGDKPFDHVMFRPAFTTEIDRRFDMAVIDLVTRARSYWTCSAPYPGDPYDGRLFQKYFSDHNPVVFRMTVPAMDDD